ncbi:MAG: MerR family transcriptional regulator [Clostridia bacterium]|nr:MerR family transcriptional regulator [Clostridia bacterium]
MRINDVEQKTGLTQKAIRLYESKGLVHISRSDNGYRDYSEEDVESLRRIKLLRETGVSLSDIKLLFGGVTTLEETVQKRKREILGESGKQSDQYLLCETVAQRIRGAATEDVARFTEAEEIRPDTHGALAVGLDMGTTTISAVVLDLDRKEQLEVYTLPHDSYASSGELSEQRVPDMIDRAERLLHHVADTYSGIVSIGLTGQMHGILYVDAQGRPVSHLINWQDKRGDRVLEDGRSTCEMIRCQTGESISTGYGIATHCYNLRHGLVPPEAVGACSIMDYLGMRLTGRTRALTHASVAAGFGLFDVREGRFQAEKLTLLGIESDFLPEVTPLTVCLGTWRGIPVSVAIGDNQASVLGSLGDNDRSILVNVGTGSQISAVSDTCATTSSVELRPFIEGRYLTCGSALCGGAAYAMLERFFRSYTTGAGLPESSQYTVMNALAREAYAKGETELRVDTAFCGKRTDPTCRGSVTGIDDRNFTPGALIVGVLRGICRELSELYEAFPQKKTHVVASGGAVRKNEVLRRLIGDQFALPVSVSRVVEEAATGAALFSALAVGRVTYRDGFPDYITYDE